MSESHEQAGFVAPEPAELAPLFPGYDIQRLIATGGMGAVYCAVQKSLDRTVALKILPREFGNDAAFCAGFEAEAKAMAKLNHPNLIGVFDFGEVNGMLYIIMEFVPGQSVYHSAYGIAIDPAEVIRLVAGICDGLAHAHEHGIIHRDIKPSNILLDLNAQPKIGDFGLARPIDRKIEEGEEIFGTPHYTAPEVVNSPHSVDHRADIFSVGVLLHELLTSRLPASDPRPASTIIHCDPRFDTIIRRATQPVPTARYSSAKEIAHDLRTIAASMAPKVPRTAAIAVPRPAAPRRSVAKPKKSSGNPTLVFMLAIVVAAVAAYVFLSKPKAATGTMPAVVVPAPSPVNAGKVVESVAPPEDSADPDPSTSPAPPVSPTPAETAGDETTPPGESISETPPDVQESVEPKSDVAAFFQRARKIMQDKTKPSVSVYRSNLRANISDFQRSAKRQIRKTNPTGDRLDVALESSITSWTTEGGRIPETMDDSLVDITGIEEVFDESLQKQVGLDDAFQLELLKHSATYILGLEKQIERLKADNDVGAIKLIEEEIQRTKESPKHFSDLMLVSEAGSGG